MRKCFFAIVIVFVLCFTCSAKEARISAPKEVCVGQPFVVTVEVPSSVTKCTISWEGHNIPLELVSDDGFLQGVALLGTDVKGKKIGKQVMKLWFRDAGRTYFSRWPLVVKNKSYPKEHLKVNSSMVNPPSRELDRIGREKLKVRAALSNKSVERLWRLPFTRPVPGSISSVYGKKRYYNGIARSRHSGIDLRAKMNTAVLAVADGVVLLAEKHYFTGGAIYIDHGEGLVSMYFHLNKLKVKKGDLVKAGDLIAYSGNSGRVTGPHLHFGVAWAGEMIDPVVLFESSLDDICKNNFKGVVEFP